MSRRLLLGLLTVLAASCAASPPSPPPAAPIWPAGAVVDLSHAFDEQTIFWPTADRFQLQKVADGVTPGGYYYAANTFSTAEHGGTHLDAPVPVSYTHLTLPTILRV